ncbi:MAG: BatD family protein [Muribaculaceae bacterium]|nr:BatD family protein [Muribaculaceae bacterium]
MNIIKRTTILLAVLLVTWTAQAVSFTAHAPSKVEEGATFQIEFVLKNGEGQGFAPPSVSWAKLIYGPAVSESFSQSWSSSGGSSSSSSVGYTMTYRATSKGKFTVGPASITVGGKVLKSNSVSIEVISAGKMPSEEEQWQRQQQQLQQQQMRQMEEDRQKEENFNDPLSLDASKNVGSNDLFVRIDINKPRVYEQQAVVCTIKLYTKYPISQFQVTKQPAFEGFLIEEVQMKPSLNLDETLNGQHYKVALLQKYILYPQQSGKLTITSGEYNIEAVQYENFSTPIGTISRPVPRSLHVQSNQQVLNALPLPEPRPATFTGAVGQFTVRTAVTPDLKTYKTSQLSYIIEGTGNIKYIKAPTIEFPKEFDVYDPKTEVQVAPVSNDVSGAVNINYTFIPQYTGEFTIPASVFTYFNPETGKYENIDIPATTVKVGKGQGSPSNHYRMKNLDIRNINKGDISLSRSQDFMVDGASYWMYYLLPLLVMVALMVYYRKQLKLRADVGLMKTKRANKVAQRRLKRARAHMKAGKRTEFYAELLTAMWGYLSDKLGIPVSELTKENIDAELSDYGVEDDLRKATLDLLAQCEFAQYAPELAGDDMGKVMDEAADLIGNLENVKPAKKQKS